MSRSRDVFFVHLGLISPLRVQHLGPVLVPHFKNESLGLFGVLTVSFGLGLYLFL